MAIYFISDAHLGSDDRAVEEIKLDKLFRFLEMVKSDGRKLYILGDLFDFWFEYKNAIPKQHLQVVFKLAGLIEQGIPIHYITGNHDFWLGNFLSREVGITVHRDSLTVTEGGMRIFLTHGDGLSPGVWKYRAFVRFPLRNKLAIFLYRLLPVDWGIPLAKAVSSRSRSHTAGRETKFLQDYEDYARRKLDEGYNAVMIGHTHEPVFRDFGNGIYVNTGDFIDHFSYGKLSEGQLSLEYMKPD
jgi:UDP-2,3-diacylglucosamine hydrolase